MFSKSISCGLIRVVLLKYLHNLTQRYYVKPDAYDVNCYLIVFALL